MKQACLIKYGVTTKVEHRGNVVDVSGPLCTEEKYGIYSCICDKHFKTKAGLSMHQAWCKEVVPIAKGQNANKITATNFSKTRPVVEITKEVQIVLDEMLANITDKQSANIATEKRRGAIERKSYDNCFKMGVNSVCKRNQLTDHNIAFQFGIDKSLVSKWKKQEKKFCDVALTRNLKLLKKSTQYKT